jgi:hypothetical protein
VRKAHFVCEPCIPATMIVPAAGDKTSTVPAEQAGEEMCCRCGAIVPNGGTPGNGLFVTEAEPTYGWPFCSCP